MVFQSIRHKEYHCQNAQVEHGIDIELGAIRTYSFILDDGSTIAITINEVEQ